MNERFGFGVFLTAAASSLQLLLAAVILLFLLAFGLWLRSGGLSGPLRLPSDKPRNHPYTGAEPLFYRENAVWHAVQQIAVMGYDDQCSLVLR